MARRYELKQRGARQDETRHRIVEATIELHQTVGPAATTVSAIAERAGVGRVTVYRHFPEPLDLDRACSGLYFERNPPPDPEAWRHISDPAARLRTGLEQTYAYHEQTEQMIARALADARDHPVMEPYHAHWRRAGEVLLEPWPSPSAERAAAIALSLAFDTWRTLRREQALDRGKAVALMEGFVCSAAAPCGQSG